MEWKLIKILVLRISTFSKIYERMPSILVTTKGRIIQNSGIKIGYHGRTNYWKEWHWSLWSEKLKIFKRMALKLDVTKGKSIWKNVIKVVITEGQNIQKNGIKTGDYTRWSFQRARLYCVVIQRYFSWGNLYSSYPTFLFH